MIVFRIRLLEQLLFPFKQALSPWKPIMMKKNWRCQSNFSVFMNSINWVFLLNSISFIILSSAAKRNAFSEAIDEYWEMKIVGGKDESFCMDWSAAAWPTFTHSTSFPWNKICSISMENGKKKAISAHLSISNPIKIHSIWIRVILILDRCKSGQCKIQQTT